MRRVRIEGDDVARLPWTPGQHVRVHVADMSNPRNWLRPRDMLRTYSIWQRDGGAIELCALDHDDTAGPGARWARELRVGDPVTFGGPNRASPTWPGRPRPYSCSAGTWLANEAGLARPSG